MKFRTLLLTAALSAAPLLAQPGPRGPRAEANFDALKAVLELTDEQVADLQAARRTFFESDLQPLMQQVREKRQALREEMQQTSPNASIVGQLQVEIVELHNQIKAKHDQQAEQLRAALTDAQRAKLDELQAAARLFPAVQQARRLNLLDAPEGGPGMGMPLRGAGGFGHGPRGPRARW